MNFMFYILIFILGAAIGSFLNVVICRLPKGRSVVKQRSCCPHCSKTLRARDLVPIFSFLLLRAKCRDCRAKISWQYPIVELAAGLFFVFIAYSYGAVTDLQNILIYRDLIFVSALLVIFMCDLKYFLVFDAVVIPMMVFAFVINLFVFASAGDFWYHLAWLVGAAVFGGGFFFLQHWLSKGKWVGAGDIRLGILMGLMLGWPLTLVGLFIAYIVGAVVSLILLGLKIRKMKSEVPFGVFLALATFITLFWGSNLLNYYLSLL
jgi:prepilin signal peptidase PulO-like enzyme (type II secretory pathway)